MDINKLREQLKIDEGVKDQIYLDHLNLPTFGIGHLITEKDPEYGANIGTNISEERINEAFEKDIEIVIHDCVSVFGVEWETMHEEAKQIIANMMFNLGKPRFTKFVKFIDAVIDKNYEEAANQMVDSRWYKQVPNRAQRLVERMKQINAN